MPKRKTVNLPLTDSILRQQLDLFRLEAGTRRQVLAQVNALQRKLTADLAGRKLSAYNKQRTKELLKQVNAVIATDYAAIERRMARTLDTVARTTSKSLTTSLERLVSPEFGVTLPPATVLTKLSTDALIMGAPSADWWAKQSQDTAFRFANAVRQGIAAGDTNETISARVASVMETSRQNVRSLVHTSIQEVANESRMETYRRNDDIVEGIMQLSTLDGNTTDVCIAYSGMEWTLDGEPIGDSLPFDGGCPRHWGCRSVEVPITKSFRELGVDLDEAGKGTRASAEGQVPADTTFEQFLSRRTEEEQNEQLGEGRAQLWRDGKITLPQLLDQRGNPLTLGELEARYD